jgi:putative zinc finger protein
MTDQGPMEPHLDASLVAAYVDGRAGSADVARIEAHLADCADCRREVIEVRRLLPGGTRRWRWSAAAALAAAAVLLLVVGRPGGPHAPTGSSTRSGHTESLAPAILAPVDGATMPGSTARFVWHSVSGAAAYRLTLTDERGDVVWTTESTDTGAAPPPTIRLSSGRTYYWSVDVLLRDGRSATTGFHGFRVVP